MKPLKITAARLRRWGMCKEGVAEFRREFPRGVTFTDAVDPEWPEGLNKMAWGAVAQILPDDLLRTYQNAVRAARAEYHRVRRNRLVLSLAIMDARKVLPK